MKLVNLLVVEKGDLMANEIKNFISIMAPSIETVLSNDFNYEKYVLDYYNDYLMSLKGVYGGYMEGLEDVDVSIFYGDSKVEKAEMDGIADLYNSYEKEMEKLMELYRDAYKRGLASEINGQITIEMKRLASEYSLLISTLKDSTSLDEYGRSR